jgi:hypothetical protein
VASLEYSLLHPGAPLGMRWTPIVRQSGNTAYSFADGLGGPIDKCADRPKGKTCGRPHAVKAYAQYAHCKGLAILLVAKAINNLLHGIPEP